MASGGTGGLLRSHSGLLIRLGRWLWQIALRPDRRRVLVIIAGRMGATALQANGIGFSLYYGKLVSDGRQIDVLGRSFDAQSSMLLASGFSTLVLVSLLLAAVMDRVSNEQGYELWEATERTVMRRGLEVVAQLPATSAPDVVGVPGDDLGRLVRSAAVDTGRVAMLVTNSVPSLITFLTAVVVLLTLEPELSAVALLLLVVASAAVYRTSLVGARHTVNAERLAPLASAELKGTVGQLRAAPVVDPDVVLAGWDDMAASGATAKSLEARTGRLLTQVSSAFIGNVNLAVGLAGLLLILAYLVVIGDHGFGSIAVYLVAARYAMTNFRAMSQKATGINRFFPSLRRMADLLQAADAQRHRSAALPDRWILTAPEPRMDGSETEVILSGPVAVLTKGFLDRARAGEILSALLGSDTDARLAAGREADVVMGRPDLAGKSLAEAFELTQADVAVMQPLLAPRGLDVSVLDEPDGFPVWQKLDVPSRSVLSTAVTRRTNPPANVVLVEQRVLAALPEDMIGAVLDRGLDALVVVVHELIPHELEHGETVVAAVEGSRLVGLGDLQWVVEHAEDLIARLGVTRRTTAGPTDVFDDDDLAGDDMDF